ncbi:hypothetical protein CMEL01_02066 [Colletotrichum melonis]|uniref:Uncharacterized protein n=1 Tax=Colletotrichum melonis TaxID=1209925 RepID=A0AAI9XPW6_9PEZI|nr:hypothetical protein CMEL01_02066 [Colletotrichum melonis]
MTNKASNMSSHTAFVRPVHPKVGSSTTAMLP